MSVYEVEIIPRGAVATIDQVFDFTDRWLLNRDLSDHTRRAYRRNVRCWIEWCVERGIDPLNVKFTHVNAWARWLESERGYARRSLAQALSSLSSWYKFLIKMKYLEVSPVPSVDRPKIDKRETSTIGFTADEAQALIAAAQRDRWLGDRTSTALTLFMVQIGSRISEACGVLLSDMGFNGGHRYVTLRMKGHKTRQRAIPPALSRAIDLMLEERAVALGVPVEKLTGPLFADAAGRVLTPRRVFRYVRRLAQRAKLPGAAKLSPHSYRHGWATIARETGSSLETRQYALGHVSAETTQGYDRSRFHLDQDPSYLVAAAVAGVRAGADREVDGG